MISAKMASTLLYAFPAFPNLIGCYRRRLKYLYSYECNSRETAANVIYDKIFCAADALDNLLALRNAMVAALGFLTKPQRDAIEGIYFKGVNKDKLAERLGISLSLLRSRKNSAIDKLRRYIEIFGFSENKIIEYFDNERIFIECAERVDEAYKLSLNFKGGER